MKKDVRNLVVILIALLVLPDEASAYLDPGTGSYIFQLIVAAVFGGLFALKTFWGNIKTFVRTIFPTKRNGA